MQIMSKFADLDREQLDHRRQITKQALLDRRQSVVLDGNQFKMWPLFFRGDNSIPETEVDICTSALGIIAGSKFELTKGNYAYSAVSDAVSLLLYMRNDDGSWPTHISLVGRNDTVMEGIINDTYYALSALMAIDFLSQSPKINENKLIDPKSGKTLKKYADRLKYIEKSAEWLLNNRVGRGWRHTGITYLTNPSEKSHLPANTTPSAHAIIILSDIMNQLRDHSPRNGLIEKIQRAVDETVQWFHDIRNQDGGFGTKWSENSRISNTAKVILALSSVNCSPELKTDAEKTLHKAVKWLVSHYNPDKITTEDVCEKFSQIVTTADGTFARDVFHEDFIEPLVIESLIRYKSYCNDKDIKQYNKRKVNSVISLALKNMLNMQVQSGKMRGLVRCHRSMEGQHYAMYSSCDFFCAISSLIESRLDRVIVTNKRITAVCMKVLLAIAVISAVIALVMNSPGASVIVMAIGLAAREILINLISSLVEKHIL